MREHSQRSFHPLFDSRSMGHNNEYKPVKTKSKYLLAYCDTILVPSLPSKTLLKKYSSTILLLFLKLMLKQSKLL